MQLFALTDQNETIDASSAQKKQNYHCLECSKIVRLRGGFQRRLHFYHLDFSPSCRLNGKSAEHLETQLFLLNLLGKKECLIEKKFVEIKRIADVVWQKHKIIFEIQCSPISSNELLLRTKDYLSIGYQTVWILHDKQFNQYNLSSAEYSLRRIPYYYTNINSFGEGVIYDQMHFDFKNKRVAKSHPLPLSIESLFHAETFPRFYNHFEKYSDWPFFFKGSLLDRFKGEEKFFFENLFKDWQNHYSPKKITWRIFFKWLKRTYLSLFRLILEKVST